MADQSSAPDYWSLRTERDALATERLGPLLTRADWVRRAGELLAAVWAGRRTIQDHAGHDAFPLGNYIDKLTAA